MVSSITIVVLLRTKAATLALDQPNRRSLHTAPTPRLGGLGIIAGLIVAWCYAAPEFDPRLVLAFLLLAGISLLDDIKNVNVAWRFTLHLVSSLVAMTAMLYDLYGIWLALAATLMTTWMINLYNFMDGSDGLAGGMAIIGFGTYGAAALAGGDFSFAVINLSVAAAALGFLLFNFPPAKVFMGDVGAIPLGYLAAVFGVTGWLRGDWTLWFAVIVFSPFIVDATVTLIKRALRGARVWQAHREHYYQRLVQSGLGHRGTALAEYALMMLCSAAALAGTRYESLQLIVAGTLALGYAGLIVALEKVLPAHA